MKKDTNFLSRLGFVEVGEVFTHHPLVEKIF